MDGDQIWVYTKGIYIWTEFKLNTIWWMPLFFLRLGKRGSLSSANIYLVHFFFTFIVHLANVYFQCGKLRHLFFSHVDWSFFWMCKSLTKMRGTMNQGQKGLGSTCTFCMKIDETTSYPSVLVFYCCCNKLLHS